MAHHSKKTYADSRYSIITSYLLFIMLSFSFLLPAQALPSATDLSVWVNEAIVTAYTFDNDHLIDRQKQIAKYFTAQGWINYSKAFDASKLRDAIQKNNYTVSAVALLPPQVVFLKNRSEWQATMPLLVLYKNKSQEQKQTLDVVITFVTAKPGEGIRGLALTSYTTKVTTPGCRCEGLKEIRTIV